MHTLRSLPRAIAHTCVTSPPYWGLRDYGVPGQFGLEPTLKEYLARMVEVFREVRRVLRVDGTLWLNVGDAYDSGTTAIRCASEKVGSKHGYWTNPLANRRVQAGLGVKQLLGLPWRLAFALQADGWILRSDVIWAKPNPMPESVTDRPTRAHEYLFLFAKRSRYFYDERAIREPVTGNAHARGRGVTPKSSLPRSGVRANASFHAAVNRLVTSRNARTVWAIPSPPRPTYRSGNRQRRLLVPTRINDHRGSSIPWADKGNGRNCRSVWWVGTHPFRGAHFATFPEKLVERPILAGSPLGGLVLDPFCGSGTTLAVAKRLGRHYLGIDLNPKYVSMSRRRVGAVQATD